MYQGFPNRLKERNTISINGKELVFFGILCLIAIVLYVSLINYTQMLLVALTIPLVLYDRAFMFPMFMTISLSQGAYTAPTSGVGTADASYAESLTLLAVSPMLLYDLITQKSKMIPFRFVIYYVIFIFFVYLGIFIYFQHPENAMGLSAGIGRYSFIPHSVFKSIKIIFYLFYLRVLINYPVSTNYRTLEFTRRCIPFIVFPLGVYLLLYGRVQNGAGYTGTLQLGDVHHGVFTSQLCSLTIYLYITLFSRKPNINFFTRFFSLGAIVMVGVMIMVMGSRNGLLSFFIVSCLGVFIHLKRRSPGFQFVIVSSAFVAGVITVILSLNSPTVERAIYMTEQAGGGDRTYYWEAGLKAIQSSPIFGLGGDETASIGAVTRSAPPGVSDRVMHNTYLEMAVEYGLIALVFYLAFVFYAMKWGYRLYKLALDKQDLLLAAPGLSYVVLMIAAFFISDVWDTAIWYNISVIFALAIQLLYPKYINKKRVNKKLSFQQSLAQLRTERIG
jgi:O-antigen ligase